MKVNLKEKVLGTIPSDRFMRAEEVAEILTHNGMDVNVNSVKVYCSKLCNEGLLENSWGKGYKRAF
jgi:hypothetical protein